MTDTELAPLAGSAAATADDGRPLATPVPGVYLFPESFEEIVALLRRGIAGLAAGEP